MESNELSGASTAVITRPDNLPTTEPEQSLTVPAEPAVVSQRLIDDVNSAVPEATKPAVPESPHARIRKDTLQQLAGMASDEQGWNAVKAALKSYDAEVGMGKDASGREVPLAQYQREYRRLRQKLYEPFVTSALDSKAQTLDETISPTLGEHSAEVNALQNVQKVEWAALHNPLLMKEAARDDVLRKMVIKETSSRIDAAAGDPVEAAFHKQHLIKAVYDQAKTVPSADGGVTEDWARRAIRAEQRKSVLGLLATPEGAAAAVAKAQEWIAQEKTADYLPSDVNKGRAELGKAILRIKVEQEKKAAKASAAEKLANDPRAENFRASQVVAQNEMNNNTVVSSGLDPLKPTEGLNPLTSPRTNHVSNDYVSPEPFVDPVTEPVTAQARKEPIPAEVPDGYDYANGPMQADIAAHIQKDADSGRTAELEERRKKIDEQLAVFMKEHTGREGSGIKARLLRFGDRHGLALLTVPGLVVAAGVAGGGLVASLQHEGSSSQDKIDTTSGQGYEQVSAAMPSEAGIGPEKDGVVPIDVAAMTASESKAPIDNGNRPEAVNPIVEPVAEALPNTGKTTPAATQESIGDTGSAMGLNNADSLPGQPDDGPFNGPGMGGTTGGGSQLSANEGMDGGFGSISSGAEVGGSSMHTFKAGETFGEILAGSKDPNVISAYLNDSANLDRIEATVKANIGKPGFPATAAEVDAVFQKVRNGELPMSAGWSMSNLAIEGETYVIPPADAAQAGIDTTASSGDTALGAASADETVAPELGKPPENISFGRRLAGFFKRS